MSNSKPDLSRAGTMEVTAKEGTTFLDKNLTDWKKPYLMNTAEEDGEGENDSQEESAEDENNVEDDAPAAEEPPAKKSRLSKATTMLGTAKEAKGLLAGEKLADTRQETKLAKQRRANKLKRVSTMAKAKADAEAVYGGDLDLSEGRTLRKRPNPNAGPAKKPAMKKAGTMQATAKEGKAYLKRSTPNKGKAKKGKGKGKK